MLKRVGSGKEGGDEGGILEDLDGDSETVGSGSRDEAVRVRRKREPPAVVSIMTGGGEEEEEASGEDLVLCGVCFEEAQRGAMVSCFEGIPSPRTGSHALI